MTSEKKIEANKNNAQASTGPITEEGKAVVARNAVKHGIFAKELVISGGAGKENPEEFQELLNGLIESLNPQNKFQYILVEKIAADIWRLKRTIRCETGYIRLVLDTPVENYQKTIANQNPQLGYISQNLEKQIEQLRQKMDENRQYIICLQAGSVSFQQPVWKDNSLRLDIQTIVDNFIDAKGINTTPEYDFLRMGGPIMFEDKINAIKTAQYNNEDLSEFLIERFEKENLKLKQQIKESEIQIQRNSLIPEISTQMYSLPQSNAIENILRYEKSMQNSIRKNYALFKELQSKP